MNQPQKQDQKNEREHISYSSVKQYQFCPFSYKIKYKDGIRLFPGNEYTFFGKAIHKCEENLFLKKTPANIEDIENVFLSTFNKEINKLPPDKRQEFEEFIATDPDQEKGWDKKKKERHKTILHMLQTGGSLALEGYKSINEKFPEAKVVSVEERHIYPLTEHSLPDVDWLQIEDLILETGDGYHHMIDHKSASWGWDSKKRTDKMVLYQLAFYKYFYSKLKGVPLDKIKTYFLLLKRTAKKEFIEIFEVSIGPKRIKNALTLLDKFIYNRENDRFPKNRLGCNWCEYKNTQYCPSVFKQGRS